MLENLGYHSMDDVQSTKTGNFGPYARPHSVSYASLNHNGIGEPSVDLVTRFEDGNWLISSNGGFTTYSEAWQMYTRKESGDLGALQMQHEASIQELKLKHGSPLLALDDRAAYCAFLEELFEGVSLF